MLQTLRAILKRFIIIKLLVNFNVKVPIVMLALLKPIGDNRALTNKYHIISLFYLVSDLASHMVWHTI